MKLTKKEAIELSIKKWEWIVKNNGKYGSLINHLPELTHLTNYCGLCDLYWEYDYCGECPLKIDNYFPCFDINHPFFEWGDRETKENAQKVLDLIKSIKL